MSRRRIFARIKRGLFEREESFWSGRDAACWEEMVNETLDLLERLTMTQFDIRTYAIGLRVKRGASQHVAGEDQSVAIPSDNVLCQPLDLGGPPPLFL